MAISLERRTISSFICEEGRAYEEIKQRILEGRYPPGMRLIQRALACDMGASTSPVVVALRMLERDGMVVKTPGLGACVRRWTPEETMDLLRLRACSESLAAYLCASRRDASDLMLMAEANAAVEDSLISEDVDANMEAELRFHTAVVRGAKSPDLERNYCNLSIAQRALSSISMAASGRLVHCEGHAEIIAAITRQDSNAAEQAARAHVDTVMDIYRSWVGAPL